MASAPVGPVMPSVTEELTSQARMSYCFVLYEWRTAKFTVAIGLYGAMPARKSAAADGMCCCKTRSRPRPVPPRGRNTFQRGPRRAHRPRP